MKGIITFVEEYRDEYGRLKQADPIEVTDIFICKDGVFYTTFYYSYGKHDKGRRMFVPMHRIYSINIGVEDKKPNV